MESIQEGSRKEEEYDDDDDDVEGRRGEGEGRISVFCVVCFCNFGTVGGLW